MAIALVLAGHTLLHAAPASADASIAAPRDGLLATCAACHGAAGEGSESVAAPRLAGQNADYLGHALSMFKAGTRVSPVMQPIANTLSDDDMRALAGYFAAQHPPVVPAKPAAPGEIAAGMQLAQSGAGLAACFSCHAAGGKGNGARFPAIAGQPASFTVARLHEFQARAKQGSVRPGTMTAVAAQMSDVQIEAAAAYLSTLPR